MTLIDKSRQPLPPPRKTKAVKLQRSATSGRCIRTVRADSDTLSDDLRYVFSSNVREAIRKK
jgi:hypothetical protein